MYFYNFNDVGIIKEHSISAHSQAIIITVILQFGNIKLFAFWKIRQLVNVVMDCLSVMNGNLFHLLACSVMPNDFIHGKYITYYIIMSTHKITYNNNNRGTFICLGHNAASHQRGPPFGPNLVKKHVGHFMTPKTSVVVAALFIHWTSANGLSPCKHSRNNVAAFVHISNYCRGNVQYNSRN